MRSIVLLALALLAFQAEGQNAVLDWNLATLGALKKDASAPLLVARALAILHSAQREAVVGEQTPETSGAAASIAGHTIAASLLPNHRATFDALREHSGADAQREAAARGEAAARRVLESRANDGSSSHVSYIPRAKPGDWRRTPSFYRPPELPQWASKVRLFALEKPDQFRPSGPPALTSAEWAKALNEVKALGAKASTVRTEEQTTIAKFWSDFSNTETPPGHWNSIARTLATERKLPLSDCAGLFATLNIALTDAGIACWNAKYEYNFWRPVTAIPRAAEDGNESTVADEKWASLLTSPAHPEYPSGHSSFSGAALVVLANSFGSEDLTFTVQSDALPGVTRKFTNLRVCAEECGASRVYGGIHHRFSCVDGMKLGEAVAQWILQHKK